jgi:hypothetical protein
MEDMGCPYRKWGWHDGGPDHKCTREHNNGKCCEDSWSDWYQCETVKEELKNIKIITDD